MSEENPVTFKYILEFPERKNEVVRANGHTIEGSSIAFHKGYSNSPFIIYSLHHVVSIKIE